MIAVSMDRKKKLTKKTTINKLKKKKNQTYKTPYHCLQIFQRFFCDRQNKFVLCQDEELDQGVKLKETVSV